MGTKPKVAIVHDWLTAQGGGERVVMALHKAFPKAPIFTSVFSSKKLPQFANLDVRTSFLQKMPLSKKKHQLYPTLRALAFESFDFSDFDVVLSSSSAESKGIITSTETMHISYIHTPTRYYWSGYRQYLNNPGYFGPLDPLVKKVMPKIVKKMRIWDYAAAQRPDFLLANSQNVKNRIKKYYKRDSMVLNPPVDLKRFKKGKKNEYYLVVSRLIPYKKVDLAVRACKRLGRKLVIIGNGPEMSKLKALSNNFIHFKGDLTDNQTANYYKNALAFIFTANEDFGITPLESMACGKPVICFGKGGATESVINKKTGIFFEKQNVNSLVKAILEFEKMSFNSNLIVKRAQKFSEENFVKNIKKIIEEKYIEFKK